MMNASKVAPSISRLKMIDRLQLVIIVSVMP